MNIVVVYNQSSGSGFTQKKLEAMMARADIVVDAWIQIEDGFEKRLAPYIDSGRTIAVVGGDGTQRAVAALVRDTAAVMAPLPGGTLNHFTKDLGVPQDMEAAISRLPRLKYTAVDVATVNGRAFVNNSSVGLYPHSLLEREKTENFFGKWPAAIGAALRSLLRFRRYSVTINDQPMRTPFIFVGNNTYAFEKSMFAERDSLNDGTLTLFVLRSWSRLAMIRTVLFDRFTSKRRTDEFIIDHPTEIRIESKQGNIAVSLDGEVVRLGAPLVYKVHPNAIKVLV